MLKNLKLLREEAGITQRQLADTVSVSQQSINKYENHNIEPDIETLIRIADYFHTSVDLLIGHIPVPQIPEDTLSVEECNLIRCYRQLTSKQKACIQMLADSYQDHP